MGASTSSAGSDQDRNRVLKRVAAELSEDEGQAIKKLFVAIAGGPERTVYDEASLKAYLQQSKIQLSPSSVSGLFNALLGDDKDSYRGYTHNNHPQQSFLFFAQHSCTLLKGTLQDRAERLYIFCSAGNPSLTKISLTASMVEIIKVTCESQFIQQMYPHMTEFASDEKSIERLCSFLLETLPGAPADKSDFEISQNAFEEWFSKSELTQRIAHLGFSCILNQEAPHTSSVLAELSETARTNPHQLLVPMKTTHPLIRERFSSQLLDHSSLLLLSHFIPVDYRGKLYPLFSSFHHGESYSMLCKQLVSCQGPTLIVVKDTESYIFGAFAAEKWQFGPKFKGNPNCFLFSLAPTMGVHLPSGYNQNYMYLEQNAQTLPNGLGMGGQMEYFGLWLSADYGNGHSKAKPKCSTYNSPRLSKDEEFKVQLLEVWGVGDAILPEEVDGECSILDKDNTATTLLEMAGKKMYSKDIREAPDEK